MPFVGYIMIRLLLPPKLWYFIHHRETKEQENLKFLPEEQFFASLSHGIPPSSPFSYRDWSLVGLCFFPLILDIAIYSCFRNLLFLFSCDVSYRRLDFLHRPDIICRRLFPSFLPSNRPQTRTPSGRCWGSADPFLGGEECG